MIHLGQLHNDKDYMRCSQKMVCHLSKLKKMVGNINNASRFNPVKALNEI